MGKRNAQNIKLTTNITAQKIGGLEETGCCDTPELTCEGEYGLKCPWQLFFTDAVVKNEGL